MSLEQGGLAPPTDRSLTWPTPSSGTDVILYRPRRWTVQQGPGPVVATAIHDGHELRRRSRADGARRRRSAARGRSFHRPGSSRCPAHSHRPPVPLRVRPQPRREDAVYETPDQSWGLEVWKAGRWTPTLVSGRSTCMLTITACSATARRRRGTARALPLWTSTATTTAATGPAAPHAAGQSAGHQIGTFSMPRDQWACLVDPLMDAMRRFDFNGRRLDVREKSRSRARASRPASFMQRYPGRAARSPSSSRNSSWTSGPASPTPHELAAMR